MSLLFLFLVLVFWILVEVVDNRVLKVVVYNINYVFIRDEFVNM